MIRTVNIDGKDYIIRKCTECPFFHDGCWEYAKRCQHPSGAREIPETKFDEEGIQKDCPLGMIKDCCTCKYEATKGEWTEPCCLCMTSLDCKTGKMSTPSRWEAKE